MRPYELVVLLHPDLEIDADAPISKLEKLVDNVDGKVVKRDNWGKKRLAYRIKKQNFAVYVYFELLLDPLKVRQLENTILITEEVLRHLLVSRPEVKESKKKPAKTEAKTAEPVAAGAAEEEGSDG